MPMCSTLSSMGVEGVLAIYTKFDFHLTKPGER